MSEEPIGWRVSGIAAPKKISAVKAEPYAMDFKTKDEAEGWKKTKQAQGWTCCVTSLFVSPQKRGKERMKGQQQTAPKRFNKDWTLHGGA